MMGPILGCLRIVFKETLLNSYITWFLNRSLLVSCSGISSNDACLMLFLGACLWLPLVQLNCGKVEDRKKIGFISRVEMIDNPLLFYDGF